MYLEEKQIYVDAIWENTQGLCDLIGKAIRFWRLNFLAIIKAMAVPSLVLMFSTMYMHWFLVWGTSRLSGPIEAAIYVGLLVLSAMGSLGSLIIITLRQMAFVRVFCGFAADLPEALAATRKKFLTTVGVSLLTLALIGLMGGGLVLFWRSVSGIARPFNQAGLSALVVIFLVVIFLLFMAFMLLPAFISVPVLACEAGGPIAVVKRSVALTFRNFGRVMSFGLLLAVVVNVMDTGFAVPALVLQMSDYFMREYGGAGGGYNQHSLWVMILQQIWSALKDLFLRPIVVFAFGMLYLDLLCRSDGLDLRRRLLKLQERKAEIS